MKDRYSNASQNGAYVPQGSTMFLELRGRPISCDSFFPIYLVKWCSKTRDLQRFILECHIYKFLNFRGPIIVQLNCVGKKPICYCKSVINSSIYQSEFVNARNICTNALILIFYHIISENARIYWLLLVKVRNGWWSWRSVQEIRG